MSTLPHEGAVIAQRFVIEALAGQGGMGSVYRAHDLLLKTRVALKVLPIMGATSSDVDRFSREARTLASLSHSGIVRYVAHGATQEGMPFLAMEWLEGEDLWERLHRQHLSIGESVLLMHKIADALACAHRRGIVHRDLKPSNLFLRDKLIERVTLLDFGVARTQRITAGLTQTGALVGTPGYMAPEQARGRAELRPSADVFALGCVMYECLAGRPPFVGEHLEAILVKILFEEAPPISGLRSDLPESLEILIGRMLHKDPAERIPDAMALLDELRGIEIRPKRPEQSGGFPSAPQWLTDSEQKLVTVVYARQGDPQTLEITLSPSHVEELSRRLDKLREDLSALGLRTEIIADGALVGALTVEGETSALDQAERAARCALLVHDGWPEATVSVATGRGVLSGPLPLGEAIGRAVHLLHVHLTQPATEEKKPRIIVDEATAGLCGPRFRIVPYGDGILALYGVRPAAEQSRALLGRPTPCVGREPDLSMLDAALHACIEEVTPRSLLVVAPPGAGKARLRHEFLRRLASRGEDLLVLASRGDLLGGRAPFALLRPPLLRLCGMQPGDPLAVRRDKLRRRIGGVVSGPDAARTISFLGELCGVPFPDEEDAQLLAARGQPRLMEEGVRRAFIHWLREETAAHPVLLLLEALQWSDDATVALIDAALREIDDRSLFVLALARPEVLETFPRLWHERVQLMHLRPLSKKASEQLVRQTLGPAATPTIIGRIVEQAAGNALFLEELIRAEAEGKGAETPKTVLAMLQARIGRLEPGARRVLRAASIFGDSCWSGGVAALLGAERKESDRWLDVLEQAELLDRRAESKFPSEPEYRFRHALMREAAYSLLADADRTRGHRLAAAFLEGVGETAAVLSYHFEQAGEYDKALYHHVGASDDAAHLDLLTEQRRHYEGARRMLALLPDEPAFRNVHIDILLKQAELGLISDETELQLARLAKARVLAESLADPRGPSRDVQLNLAYIELAEGRVLHYASRYVEARQRILRVLPIAEAFGYVDLARVARRNVAMTLTMQGAVNEADAAGAHVLAELEARGDLVEWSRWLGYRAIVLAASGRWVDARALLARGQQSITRATQPSIRVRSLLLSATTHVVAMDWPMAAELAQSALELSRRYSEPFFHFLGHDLLAWAESHLGRHDAALEHRARAEEIRDSVGGGFARDWFSAGGAEILLRAGRVDASIALCREVLVLSTPGELLFSRVIAERVLASGLSHTGAPLSDVESHLKTAIELATLHGQVVNAAYTEVVWGVILRQRGDEAGAAERIARGIAALDAAGCDYAANEARSMSAAASALERSSIR